RTQAQCDWLNQKISEQRIIELTCSPALTNFTLTKLLWVRDNEPETWRRFHWVLLPKDYVRLRLTGEHAMDMAEASGTLMLDVAHRRWSDEMMSAAGLPMTCLPKLYESPEICARISQTGAAHTGLKPGTPVVPGARDPAARDARPRRRAHSASRSPRPRHLDRTCRRPHPRTRAPRRTRGRSIQPERYFFTFCRDAGPGPQHSPGWRRRTLATLAADS